MNKSYAWAIAILAVSANYGCGKAPSEKAADARRSNLGVSPANWPQEGPARGQIILAITVGPNQDSHGALLRSPDGEPAGRASAARAAFQRASAPAST